MHPFNALASGRLGEPPPSYYTGRSLVAYLKEWADHLVAKEGAGAVAGIWPICQTYGGKNGYLVTTSSGRRFVLDCDTGNTWTELIDAAPPVAQPAPAPAKPVSSEEALGQIHAELKAGTIHLFLDPGVSLPDLRAGHGPSDRVARQLPGYEIPIWTPVHTYLFRAPAQGITQPTLAWGPKPQPAGDWAPSAAWGNATLYEPKPGKKPALPDSKATFTKEALIDGKAPQLFAGVLKTTTYQGKTAYLLNMAGLAQKPTLVLWKGGVPQEVEPPPRAPAPKIGL